MRKFGFVLILSICLILSGCFFHQEKDIGDIRTTSSVESSSSDWMTTLQSDNSLINIICSRQDVLGNIDINTAQILSTDSRIGLSAAIMKFTNPEGKEALASAVIKSDQVISIEASLRYIPLRILLTTCRQNRQGIRDHLIQLLPGHIPPENLMEYLSIFNKQHPLGMTCRSHTVSHHQNRLSILINLREQFQQFSCRLGIQCPGRFICQH